MPVEQSDAAGLRDAEEESRELRERIDALDAQIVELIAERTAISRQVGKQRRAAGGPKLVHTRELEILERYSSKLGKEGNELASILLRLGRGRLGH